MWITYRSIPGLALWGAAMYGVLHIGQLPGSWGHGICGPWGCGPPMQALVAAHGFWITAAAPFAYFAVRRWPAASLRRWGTLLLLVAGLVVLGVAAWEAWDWLPGAQDWQRGYFAQRTLFVLVTLVEVPTAAMALCGAGFWVASFVSRNTTSRR